MQEPTTFLESIQTRVDLYKAHASGAPDDHDALVRFVKDITTLANVYAAELKIESRRRQARVLEAKNA